MSESADLALDEMWLFSSATRNQHHTSFTRVMNLREVNSFSQILLVKFLGSIFGMAQRNEAEPFYSTKGFFH